MASDGIPINPTVPVHAYHTVSPDGTKMIFFFNPVNGKMHQPFGFTQHATHGCNEKLVEANAAGKLMDPITGKIFTPEI
jgi:hypothetical protein